MLMKQSSFPSLGALTGALTGRLGRRGSANAEATAHSAQEDQYETDMMLGMDGSDLVLENQDGSKSYAHRAPTADHPARDPAIEADAALLDALRSKIDEGRPLTSTSRAALNAAEAPQPASTHLAQDGYEDSEEDGDHAPTDAQGDPDTMIFAAPHPSPHAAPHTATAAPLRLDNPILPAADPQQDAIADDFTDEDDSLLGSEADDLLLGASPALSLRAAQVQERALSADAACDAVALPDVEALIETATPTALSLHHSAAIGDPDDIIDGFSAEEDILLIELVEARSVPRISFRAHPDGHYTDLVLLQDGVIPARRVIRVKGAHELTRSDLAFSIAGRLAA